MTKKLLPFNITFLDPSRQRLGTLLPVQTQDIFDGDGDFHPQGLYSSEIFGRPGDKVRMQRHSFIDMKAKIIHPKVLNELGRIKNLYRGIIAGTAYAVWNEKEKDFEKSDILDGETGYAFFMSHYNDLVLKRNQSAERDLRIDLIEKYRGKSEYRYMVVLPAGLRDIQMEEDGRPVEDEINAFYRKALRTANTITADGDNNSPTLDSARWTLQNTFNDIYNYLETFLTGKGGFLQSKWARRNLINGTRNIITAMDPSPKKLGGLGAHTVNDTMIGLHQYLKGTLELSIWGIKNGPAARLIAALPGNIPVVHRQTLVTTYIEPSARTKEKWGTDEGIETLINGYEDFKVRHKYATVDDHYIALIWRDKKTFRVLHDINEIEEEKRKDVRPMTWSELYYISVYKNVHRTPGFPTRYPITGMGSIYPSNTYLRVTTVGEILTEVGADGLPIDDKSVAVQMPILGKPFFDSMSVHVSKVGGLDAD